MTGIINLSEWEFCENGKTIFERGMEASLAEQTS